MFNLALSALIHFLCISPEPQPAAALPAEPADWWNETVMPPYAGGGQPLPFVHVAGNKFVNEQGDTLLFRGLSISDPDKIEKNGRWGRRHFETIRSWGANLVRIPVHPAALRQRGMENYLQLLDQAVQWCGELGMYVIIDWHSIGNLQTEIFEHRRYDTSKKETYNFWKTIAEHYKGVSTVAFYELFNEPTECRGTFGKCSWEQWKTINEDLIDIIYAHDKRVIPLVAGFDWAYDLRPLRYHPVERAGIAYVTHPYPGKCPPPREANWEESFGFAADRYPVIATEMGYSLDSPDPTLREDGSYREAILRYFDRKGISWCAWVFDPDWTPQMIRNWDYEPTHQGAFFRDAMLREK